VWFVLTIALAIVPIPGTARASTGSISMPPAGILAGSTDTGFRQRVPLTRRADVLVGRPRLGAIDHLIVAATDLTTGHLIVREITRDDGGTSFLLTAPASLAGRVRRITMLLRRDHPEVELWAHDGDRWVSHPAETVTIGAASHRAFSVDGLGSYWLAPPRADLGADDASSPQELLGGRLSAALSSWLWPAIALGVAGFVARTTHRFEKGRT
jgi:hypothetical protein